MNDFGQYAARAALHVTLAAVPAVVFVAWIGRRRPAEGGTLAGIALALLAALGVAACVPLPDAWTWSRPVVVNELPILSEKSRSDPKPSAGWQVPLGWLTTLPDAPAARPRVGWSAWHVVGFGFAAGLLVEVVRLALGLASVARCRRRSCPILIGPMFDELCDELGVTATVDASESSAVSSAATVGWWRPVVLLAPDWRDWPAGDLRAVLAHELAHVRRRDYLTGLAARLCLLTNFYHPLVRWLAARQRLAQELAADALAAPLAGGRGEYLRALARLALRQDSRPGLARPFFADRNGLERRIDMLRVTGDVRRIPAQHWIAGLGIVAAVLATSALRGPAQPPAGPELRPLALEYLSEKAESFIAIRPAMLLTRPEMKPIAQRWQALMAKELTKAGFGPGFTLRLDEIDQIVGHIDVRKYSDDEMKALGQSKRNALMFGAAVVRTTRDVDWPALLGATPISASLKKTGPNTFAYETEGNPPVFTVVDARTLVVGLHPDTPPPGKGTLRRWGAAAQAVERAGLVVVLDNQSGKWTDFQTDDPALSAVKALAKVKSAACGVHWDERVRATFAAEVGDEPAAQELLGSLQAVRALLFALAGDPASSDDWTKFAVNLLTSATAERTANIVRAESRTETRWADILGKLSLDEMFGLPPSGESNAKP